MFAQAMRLNPHFPVYYVWARAQNYMFMGEYDAAIEWTRRYVKQAPSYHPNYAVLTASLALSGHVEEARTIGEQLLHITPNFRANLRELGTAWRDPECRARYARGLEMAFGEGG